MNIYIVSSIFLFILYIWLIRRYAAIWLVEPPIKTKTNQSPQHSFCIIIVARNESDVIQKCITSCLNQDYPSEQFEIIVFDDFSDDDTFELASKFKSPKVNIISLADLCPERKDLVNKKWAIQYGVAETSHEIITTTDADCFAPPGWLKSIDQHFHDQRCRILISPVNFIREEGLLNEFQFQDLLAMNLVTASGIIGKLHYMGFGANLAYQKSLFQELGGFQSMQYSSGDDFFIVQEAAKLDPQSIFFNKNQDAIVHTAAVQSWQGFVQQRLRWGTKNKHSDDRGLLFSAAIVYLNAVNLIFFPIIVLAFQPLYFFLFFLFLFVKMVIDFRSLEPQADFFNEQIDKVNYLKILPLHMVYLAVLGTLSIFLNSYTWKGRKSR